MFASRREKILLAVVSLVCGTLYTAWLTGWGEIDPRDTSWLRSDAVSHYLGFAFMRQDPVTALPLTLTDRIGYPLVVSAAHLDIIPVAAVLLLPFNRLLPHAFQYLGAFQCLSAAALFYFGHQIARVYGTSEVLALASGVVFLTNAVFTLRVGSHAALTSQFFLVWVLYESLWRFARLPDRSFREAPEVRRRGLVATLGICVLALGVSPYIALMVAAFCIAYVVNLVFWDRASARLVLVALPTAALVMYAAAWFFGYLTSGGAPGFGTYSANLNTFVNPGLFSRFAGPLPVAAPEQLEGAAYLGVGVGAALVFALVSSVLLRRVRMALKPFVPFLCVSVAAFGLALTDRVTLGSRVLVNVPLPPSLHSILAVFRSSGRMSWPLFYLGVVVAVVGVSLALPRRVQGAVAALIAVLQVFEYSTLRDGLRASLPLTPRAPVALRSPAFLRLGEAHRHLVVLPAWQCGPSRSPGGEAGYATFGLLAAAQHMTINSYYGSRYSERVIRVHCDLLPAELRRSGPEPDTAYVVTPEFLTWFSADGRRTHECGVRDGYNLCVRLGTLY